MKTNNKISDFVTLAGNASQVIIASSIQAELYFKIRKRIKTSPENNPNDDGDHSPSSPQIPLAA